MPSLLQGRLLICEQGVFPHQARGWLGWEQQEKAITKEQDQTFCPGFFWTHHPGFLLSFLAFPPCQSKMVCLHGSSCQGVFQGYGAGG